MNPVCPSLAIRVACVVCPLAVAACSQDYTYVPVTTTSAAVAGRPAAEYAISARGAPSVGGEVRVATLGFVPVRWQEPTGWTSGQALDVRMVMTNDGDARWAMDLRDQFVELTGGGQWVAPLVALGPETPPTRLVVEPGSQRTVDLFFPLPQPLRGATSLPTFDVHWSLYSNGKRVERRTTFDRIAFPPDSDESSRWQRYAL